MEVDFEVLKTFHFSMRLVSDLSRAVFRGSLGKKKNERRINKQNLINPLSMYNANFSSIIPPFPDLKGKQRVVRMLRRKIDRKFKP